MSLAGSSLMKKGWMNSSSNNKIFHCKSRLLHDEPTGVYVVVSCKLEDGGVGGEECSTATVNSMDVYSNNNLGRGFRL